MAKRNWAALTLDEQRRIANIYREGHEAAILADAADLNITPASLARICRDFLYYEKTFLGEGALAEGENVFDPTIDLAPAYHTPTSSRLTDIRSIDPKTDQGKWLEWLTKNQISAQEVDTLRLKTYYCLSNISVEVKQGIAAIEIGTRELAKEQTCQRIIEVSS